ncbi:MAG: hypothetical protein LBP22_01085 [Deltaproteobacteria bacterium]|nr:hypothetical protein [Deltaproteobacteria bacterium]
MFSARAKVKVPGVANGYSRGLSDPLHFPRPLTDGQSQEVIPAPLA